MTVTVICVLSDTLMKMGFLWNYFLVHCVELYKREEMKILKLLSGKRCLTDNDKVLLAC